MILGCNAQPKEDFWNPVPIAVVFRNVQASKATVKAKSDTKDDVDEDDKIVNSNTILHARSDVKGKCLQSS